MVHEDDVDSETHERDSVGFRRRKLGATAGGERLGCSLYEVDPGKRAWPYHYHAGNEEALYVLSGEGRLRTPDGDRRLEPGEYVALPVGPEGAHRVHNDGDEPLRYLVVSEMNDPDVTVYPDSEGIGVYAGAPPGGDADDRYVNGYFQAGDAVDYWADIATDVGTDAAGGTEGDRD